VKIKRIIVTVERTQGEPLIYAINPLTVGPANFALLAGMTAGFVESEKIREREKLVEARQAKLWFQPLPQFAVIRKKEPAK